MVDRISVLQAILAALYSSPFTSAAFVVATFSTHDVLHTGKWLPQWIIFGFLFWFPGILANTIAWSAVALLGNSLSALARHLAIGVIGGALLVQFCFMIARGFRSMGAGPINQPIAMALVAGAAVNVVMVWAVWRFDWKNGWH